MITTSVSSIPPRIAEHARVLVEAEHRDDHRARHEPGEREDVAVREVDQLQDSVDERVAEGDEAVDEPVRQPDQPDLDELLRVLG